MNFSTAQQLFVHDSDSHVTNSHSKHFTLSELYSYRQTEQCVCVNNPQQIRQTFMIFINFKKCRSRSRESSCSRIRVRHLQQQHSTHHLIIMSASTTSLHSTTTGLHSTTTGLHSTTTGLHSSTAHIT